MRRIALVVALAFIPLLPHPAVAWKCDRHPEKRDCTTTTTWDDDYYEGPYCEGPPPREDERPRCCQECDGNDRRDEGNIPGNTPTTHPGTNTTTTTRLADVAGTTTTTTQPVVLVPPATMIHQDPKPETDVKAITIDREPQRLPEPTRELPITGDVTGLLASGIMLVLGGAGVMFGRKPR